MTICTKIMVIMELDTYSSSTVFIHLASSLTIETISKKNGGGGNYGDGTIVIVDNDSTFLETIKEPTSPLDWNGVIN